MFNKLTLPVATFLTLSLVLAGLTGQFNPASRPSGAAASAAAFPSITAEMAIVLDDATSQVLYARLPNRRVASASLTKIVTAMVALERGNLADVVRVSVDSDLLAAATASSVMGLMPGDELTLEQLLYGLLLPSGADAAIAIAEHVAGSEARFVEMMNRKVKEMGLKDTRFRNPHGLDDDGHYSTVYDMAIIARSAMQNPTIVKIVGTKKVNVKISGEKELELFNGNPLIGEYRGADGVKPGYTDEAQLAIAATAKRGSRRIYVVLIRSTDLVKDTERLFDYYFPLPVLVSPRTTLPLQPPAIRSGRNG